jgi:hypothetical protein
MQSTTDFRPPGISAKQEQIMHLVTKAIASSANPEMFQHLCIERTKHNHNFGFFKEDHKYYDYYRYLLHAYLSQIQAGYGSYQQQYYQEENYARVVPAYEDWSNRPYESYGAESSHFTPAPPPPPLPTAAVQAPQVIVGTQPQGPRPASPDDESDDEPPPCFRTIVDENGVRRLVPL